MTRPIVSLMQSQVNFVTDPTRYLLFIGGYRSGKSYSLAHKIIWLAINNIGYHGALLSPTYQMLTRVMVPILEEALKLVGIHYTYKKSESIIVLHLQKDVNVYLLSAENYRRGFGLTLAWAACDEFDLLNKEMAELCFRMLVSRLTNGNIIQIAIATTPEGYGFCYETFEEKAYLEDGTPDTDKKLIRASSRDNPFIDEKYVESLSKQYPEKLLASYLDGFFTNLTTGNVYYAYDRNENGTTKTIADWHNSYPINIGIDFNVGVMASSVYIIQDNLVYAIDEFYGDQNTEALIRSIKARYPNRTIHAYPDASGQSNKTSASISDIAMLRNAGFNVKVKPSNPLVKDRINAVNGKLCNASGQRTFFINTSKCPRLVKTLEQQGYKNNEPDKSNGLDHMADGMGYMIHYNWPIISHTANRITKR